jgi:hypothetical protein
MLASHSPPEGVFLEDLCFHAQQAAEKAIKAVGVNIGWPVPVKNKWPPRLCRTIATMRVAGLPLSFQAMDGLECPQDKELRALAKQSLRYP